RLVDLPHLVVEEHGVRLLGDLVVSGHVLREEHQAVALPETRAAGDQQQRLAVVPGMRIRLGQLRQRGGLLAQGEEAVQPLAHGRRAVGALQRGEEEDGGAVLGHGQGVPRAGEVRAGPEAGREPVVDVGRQGGGLPVPSVPRVPGARLVADPAEQGVVLRGRAGHGAVVRLPPPESVDVRYEGPREFVGVGQQLRGNRSGGGRRGSRSGTDRGGGSGGGRGVGHRAAPAGSSRWSSPTPTARTWWTVNTIGTAPKSRTTRSPWFRAATMVVMQPSTRPSAHSMAARELLSTSRISVPARTRPVGAGCEATVAGTSAPRVASTMLCVGMMKLSTMCRRCRLPNTRVCNAG